MNAAGELYLRSLSDLRPRDLAVLLDEETQHWANELDWDFSDVAAAVTEAMEARTLAGCAFQEGARTLAYCYYLREDGRAVVGSVFAAAEARTAGLEPRLLDAVLAEAKACPDCARVEGQTLFSTTPMADERYTLSGFTSRPRHYMVRPLAGSLPDARPESDLRPLPRACLAQVAALVFESHQGSADAALNSVYASVERTRQFVDTLVLRDGCGRFMPEASLAAFGPEGMIGVVLCSRVSRTNGHLCQVSVLPRVQGRGLGRALVIATLQHLQAEGMSSASLSVTAGNERATRLYTGLGFGLRRTYGAHAWARPPARIGL